MAVLVGHVTPADPSFSPLGAAEWNRAHNVTQDAAGILGATASGATGILTAAQVLSLAGAQARLTYSAVAVTTANPTVAVNTFYFFDLSGLTADRTFVLPGVFAEGDEVWFKVTTGDDAFELLYTAAAGDTLDGIAGGTEVSRVFIKNEAMGFRGTVANTAWETIYEGRIAMKGLMHLTTNPSANEAANTFVYATSASPTPGVWTLDTNVGDIADATLGKFIARRACKLDCLAMARPSANLTDQKLYFAGIELNGTTLLQAPNFYASNAGKPNALAILKNYPLAVNDYVRHQYASEEGSKGLQSSTAQAVILSFTEVF